MLGLENSSTSQSSQATIENRKLAFKFLGTIGQSRTTGVRQPYLGEMFGTNAMETSKIVEYSERRGLVSKIWASGGQVHGNCRQVFLSRLASRYASFVILLQSNGKTNKTNNPLRQSWPLYYSSLSGKGEAEKSSDLMLDVQSHGTTYLESYFKAGRRVTIAHLWKCFLKSKTRSKDPGAISSAKTMFLETVDSLLRVHTDWSLEKCRSASDVKFVVWLTPDSQIINKADLVDKAHQLEPPDETVYGPTFRWHSVSLEPNTLTMLKEIVSRCPIGFPRHATSCLESKISEDTCAIVGPKGAIPSVKQSGCSIGKQQHKIFNVREELGRELHQGGGYSAAKDILFYPSKRNKFLEKVKPATDEELVQSDMNEFVIISKIRSKPYDSRREDRGYYLQGYQSWNPRVGKSQKVPQQWLPRVEEKRLREEPNDSVEAQQKRTKYWGALHLKDTKLPKPEQKPELITKQTTINTPLSQTNDVADKGNGNMSRAYLQGEVLSYIQMKTVASSLELRKIVRENRLLGKMMIDLVTSGKLESHIQTMQHYSGLLKYTLYSVPNADLEDAVVQKEIQSIEDTWAATPAQREKREQVPHLLDEIEKLKAPGMLFLYIFLSASIFLKKKKKNTT